MDTSKNLTLPQGSNTEPPVITIIADRLPEAVKALKKLAAKAERYGTPTIAWSVGSPRPEGRLDSTGRKITVMVTDVTLGALEAPRVGAFRFLARLERTPAGTIIDSIPGVTLPERFRHSTGECEHCSKVRDRKHLFVVQEGDLPPVQVGRTCLRDFMGTDTPESVASRFRWEREFRGPVSPEMLSFRRSVPSRTSTRQIRRISSGPSATQAKVGVSRCGRCNAFSSPSPPVTVISGPLAR